MATVEVKETKMAKPAEPGTDEKKNCTHCNKPLRRKKRYYRDGNYYCGKRCWKLKEKKIEEKGASTT